MNPLDRSPGTRSGRFGEWRLPLYGRVLAHLAATVVLTLSLYAALPGRGALGWNTLLSEPVRARLVGIANSLVHQLAAVGNDAAARRRVLQDFAVEYGVDFDVPGLPQQTDTAPSGSAELPAVLPPLPDRGLAPDEGIRLHADGGRYEVRLSVPWPSRPPAPRVRVEVRLTTDSLRALLALLGITAWVIFATLLLLATTLLWAPFVFGMTNTVLRITEATRDIARGRFDTRVRTRRNDELGELGHAINAMAERLQNHVDAQKQFLTDVAHEVTSPLARMRMALGLLEPRLSGDSRELLHDIEDEIRQMVAMLDELLLYSKADLASGPPELRAVALCGLLAEVLAREDPMRRIRLDVTPGLVVLALQPMLARAIGNLVRNALRHAGEVDIELSAAQHGARVELRIADRGPGVPAAAIARLGEPFFRPHAARSRDTGGNGLGLAIVRRCIGNCAGRVWFRNRDGGGFEVQIELLAASPERAAAQ